MNRPITIAVLAIGGQGGDVLVDWIVALAEREGWQAQSTSIPGVAQRTGATIYHVEAIEPTPGKISVFSAMAALGDVDIVIAAEYVDAVEAVVQAERRKPESANVLAELAAKYIARAMAYEDVIRVAALKTQPARAGRVQNEIGDQVIALAEFMHPRMEELFDLLTPRLGNAIERRPRLVAQLGRLLCGPRRVRTDTISGFLLLYVIAGLRGWRRRTLRHTREWGRLDAWLIQVRTVAAEDPGLAAELLANQRLIKSYSDTHTRGLDKYTHVMAAAERLRGHSDAASWVRRLQEADLKDEKGLELEQALRTVDSFLTERTAA